MLESMEKLIGERELIPPGSTVLCAVSGGADSICLLHALYQLRPRLGFSLAAAHYNHMLRGADADRDAAFVEQFLSLCCGPQRLADGGLLPAVPLYSGSGDVAGEAERRGMGLEETAREMRYAFLRQAARQAGADRIATAHTADDNAETVLLHLARGTGLRGLGGIRPSGDGLIRPLLTTTRREVEAYLAYYSLPHVEDESNQDDRYSRNRLRHQVTPVLEGLYPGFAGRMAETAARLRADEDCLTGLAARAAACAALRPGGGVEIPARQIAGQPDPIGVRMVRELIARLRGGDRDCRAVHLEAVVRLCRQGGPSERTDLPGGLTARREYGLLVLEERREGAPLEEVPLPLPGQVRCGDWRAVCTPAQYGGEPQGKLDFFLDQARTPALYLRPRREGDRLTLAGRPGKTIKKWMIQEKIPRALRAELPVLDCGGQVAAAAGLGPDAAFLPVPGRAAWHITFYSTKPKQPNDREETAHAGT